MAEFEKAFKFIKGLEGHNSHRVENENNKAMLLCSECFKDEGLRLDAYNIGIVDENACPNCQSKIGHKLDKKLVHFLCHRFFVRGTIHKENYGGSPLIQFNEQHYTSTNITISPWLIDDVKLIEKAGGVAFFYYGPRLWMIGEVEPLKILQSKSERLSVVSKILEIYPSKLLTKKDYFYRLRKNPVKPSDISEYDTAPDNFLGSSRFDSENFPVLYGSPDLELCVHECRTTAEDDLYLAKLVPVNNLRMLDLSALIHDDSTEFESLDIAIHFLFLAGNHSYDICRGIASSAKNKGFDGIIYPSYFSHIRSGTIPFETIYGISIRKFPELKEYAQSQSIPNVAVFGRPIKDNKVIVECINRAVINRVSYDITFGPVN